MTERYCVDCLHFKQEQHATKCLRPVLDVVFGICKPRSIDAYVEREMLEHTGCGKQAKYYAPLSLENEQESEF